jgi:hypothetical protein
MAQFAGAGLPALAGAAGGGRRFDAHQLHVEYQQRAAGNSRLGLRAVGQFGRHEQLPLGARLHQHQGFLPTLDHAIDREGRRRAARIRAVEFRAIEQLAAVLHRHLIGGSDGGRLACPGAMILYSRPDAVVTTPFSWPLRARNSLAAALLRAGSRLHHRAHEGCSLLRSAG